MKKKIRKKDREAKQQRDTIVDMTNENTTNMEQMELQHRKEDMDASRNNKGKHKRGGSTNNGGGTKKRKQVSYF